MIAGKPKEEGAALLAVLLLVAVMSVLAVASFERLQLSTRLAANIATLSQARAYASGAEALAVLRVNDLLNRDPQKTTLEGGWNGAESVLPLPDAGLARARIWDGNNCFNLNSLAAGNDPLAIGVDQTAVIQFATLMRLIDIPDRDADRIAGSLADWIDSDDLPARQGAEDRAYGQGDQPYRTGNMLLAEVSELRALAGMTGAYYEALRPCVCTLPTTELSPINVNTLTPDQAPLVAMLLPYQLDVSRARQAIAARPAAGWNSTADFWHQPALMAYIPEGDTLSQLHIRTRFFRLELDVQLGDAHVQQSALIDASITPARVVERRWGATE
jgi:general secretion pathway protein K